MANTCGTRKPLYLALMACALLLSARVIRAEDAFKLATVDVNRILNELSESKEKKKQLDDLSQAAQKRIEVKRASVKALEKKLQDSKVSPESAEAETFRKQAREYERLVKDEDDELKREFLKVNKSLTDKALKIIEVYAKKNNIDLVLDKGGQTRGPVLFGTPGADITDSVIQSMNG